MAQIKQIYSQPKAQPTADRIRERLAAFSEPPRQHGPTSVDYSAQLVDHASMNTPSREELDAKLQAIEARMDARVVSIEGKIDAALARMEGREVAADLRVTRIETTLDKLDADLVKDKTERKNDLRSLKVTMIVTAIASVIGLYAANISTLQTMLAAFESGKSISATQVELKKQSEETAALLRQMQDQLKQQTLPKK